jgi:hypothetical protein
VSGSGEQKQLARMTRGEISEDGATWTLPASRTKNRRLAIIRNDGVGGSNPSCGTKHHIDDAWFFMFTIQVCTRGWMAGATRAIHRANAKRLALTHARRWAKRVPPQRSAGSVHRLGLHRDRRTEEMFGLH